MQPTSDPLLPTAPLTRRRVLIVEDEYIIAANLQEYLTSLGYDILDIAVSVEEAVQMVTTLRPDIVLLDIRLQGKLDGIQIAEFIRSHLQIPVIFVTGHSDNNILERAHQTFPFGYVLKPVKGPELHLAIATALDCW